MSDDEIREQQLLAVFAKYDLPEPRYGEHSLRCPAHDDHVASASVNRSKGLWFCHACGAGGTAIDMVMALEEMSFIEASSHLEGLMGISVRRGQRPAGKKHRLNRWVPPALRRGA
jgi:DNA primase